MLKELFTVWGFFPKGTSTVHLPYLELDYFLSFSLFLSFHITQQSRIMLTLEAVIKHLPEWYKWTFIQMFIGHESEVSSFLSSLGDTLFSK